MIATILPGSADFHAVGYNEHKVSKGLARLIEMRNFGDNRSGKQTHHGGAYRLSQKIQFHQQPHPETAVPCDRQLQRP